ncbi:hypothetical protein GA0074695_1281 [Micromonospora viridifaciens]|uniref:Uncharacterized protein n=2 Tax=Micromonospora viridifaciens TaxID=1881 RepID=A0A1C4VA05_MICVI|nr:hypothetical protein GA0074695_1281 [Micromonospora viridifaciens]
MAARPGWQRRLLPLLLIAAALVLPVVFARQAIGAERVTVRVESCDLSGPKATQACRGTWRLGDGRAVSGPVDGTLLRPGTELQGWGNGERATTSLFTWLVAPIVIGGALLVGLGAFVVVWLRLTWRARRGDAAPR